ncbi:hypothetical protein [Microbulbifer taiwanensis]|uniref:Cadherin domain-containing protein n=1 Tax=Microbulbifer taiwanensis TaxID=986746 RepID=A0ABW1YME4_9GAMM|nr:hypothetical protein [Microbulbifer taiwanensis]
MHSAFNKKLTVLLPALFISACGGGGGGGGGSSDDSPNSPSNRAPEFVSASEVISEENNSGSLLTLSASDADGDTISFSAIGGDDQSRFLIDNGDQLRFGFAPDFENPADSDGDNVYQVTIEASDGKGGKTSRNFVITITDINEGAPEFTSASEITVEEGESDSFYTAAAEDPDRGDVTYSLSGGVDSGLFSIDSASGDLRFIDAPDFEFPEDSDGDNIYQLMIGAADSQGAASQLALEVAVTNLAAPSVRFDFPTGGANLGGKLSNIALTARAVDLESGESATEQLASISVDGRSPTQDVNNPSLWYLETPPSEGRETYPLSAQFVTGETAEDSRLVINEQLIEWPIGVSYDDLYRTYYFADTALDAIFEVGSSRRVISGPTVGSGPALNPIDMEQNFPVVRSDPKNDKFVVLNGDGSIVSVQKTSGDRTPLINPHCEPCANLPKRRAIVLNAVGTVAYATLANSNISYGEVYRYNLSTGEAVKISSSDPSAELGEGPELEFPVGIILDEDKNYLYVGDTSSDSIIRIDIATGNRTTVSGSGVGNGDLLVQPMDLAMNEEGSHIFVANGQGQNVIEVEVATGNQRTISSSDLGEGIAPSALWSIGLSADSSNLLVSNTLLDVAVLSVNIDSGDRSDIASNHVGTGPSSTWSQLDYDPVTNTLYAVSSSDSSVAAVNLEDGSRSVISDPENGAGASIHSPADILVHSVSQRAYIFDSHAKWLAEVDLANGNREVIAAPWKGTGPTMDGVGAMALDVDNNRILLLESSSKSLLAVDLDTGDREVISGNGTGTGAHFDSANGLALDISNNRAFVSNYGTGAILEVDLASGDRASLASSVHGGTDDQTPSDLALDILGNRLLVGTESGQLIAIDLDSATQSILTNGRDTNGVPVSAFSSMAIDSEGKRLFAYDGGLDGLAGIVIVELRSGQRALASK